MRRFFARRLIVLSVLLALASLLPFLGRWHWVPDLFSHFIAHYVALALLFALGLYAAGRPRWALFAGAVFALDTVRLVPYWVNPEVGREPAQPVDHVTVLQFNVNRAHPDPERIVRWIESEANQADVVALFEVTPTWERALDRLARAYPRHVRQVEEHNFGIAVLTRLEAETLEIRWIGAGNLASAVLRAKTAAHQIPFVLYATHPPPPLGGLLWGIRNEQLAALRSALSGIGDRHRILVGDLNTTPWSHWFGALAGESGLRDAQRGLGYVGTWPGGWLPHKLAIPLDHTLVSPDVAVVRRDVGPNLGSDHRLVITTLGLPVPESAIKTNPSALQSSAARTSRLPPS